MSTAQPTLRDYLVVYVLLLIGLALTVAVSYMPLGYANLPVAMAIAFAKASLVVLIFMHVRYSPRLTWIAVFAGLVWLAILLSLTLADYATRNWLPTRAPAQMEAPFNVSTGSRYDRDASLIANDSPVLPSAS